MLSFIREHVHICLVYEHVGIFVVVSCFTDIRLYLYLQLGIFLVSDRATFQKHHYEVSHRNGYVLIVQNNTQNYVCHRVDHICTMHSQNRTTVAFCVVLCYSVKNARQ